MPRFHKWIDYQVLEILSNEETGLYGFIIHFPNGTRSEYSYGEKGVVSENIFHNPDGSIQFNTGFHESEEEKWKINGEEVMDWQEFSNAS